MSAEGGTPAPEETAERDWLAGPTESIDEEALAGKRPGRASAAARAEAAIDVPAAAPQSNAEALADFVATCSALFFLAEEGHNPGVKTYLDAVHYVATSLSVGYATIFPMTQPGKAIGAFVMMVGPALSAKALEDPRPAAKEAASDPAVLERLDAILAELRAQR